MKHTVLFVCTGNVCRSPMAEYILRHRLGPDSEWSVSSAGTIAGNGAPPSRAAVQVMSEIDIDISGHRSRHVSRELVDASELVVVMTASHADQLRMLCGGAPREAFLLKSFDEGNPGGDVMDPIGQPPEVYRLVRDEIDAAMRGLIRFIERLEEVSNENSPGSRSRRF